MQCWFITHIIPPILLRTNNLSTPSLLPCICNPPTKLLPFFYKYLCTFSPLFTLTPPHLRVSHLSVLWSPLLPASDLQDAFWGDPLAPWHRGPLAPQKAGHEQGPPCKVPGPPTRDPHHLTDHSGSPKLEIHSGCVADMVSSGKDRFCHFFTDSMMTIILTVHSMRHFNHQVESRIHTLHWNWNWNWNCSASHCWPSKPSAT